MAAVLILIAVLAVVGAIFGGMPPLSLVALVAIAALVSWFAVNALWLTRVSVREDGVEVRNTLRTILVPWSDLVHIDTKYALTLHTPTGRVSAMSAPAPGRHTAWINQHRRDLSPQGGAERAGDLRATASGDIAEYIRAEWSERVENGSIHPSAGEVKTLRHWHVAALSSLVVLVIATAILVTAAILLR